MSSNQDSEGVDRRLRAALEATPEHVVLLDRDFRVLYVNRKVAELNGAEPSRFVGLTHWEAWPSSAGTEVERAFRRAVQTGETVRLEHNHAEEGGLDMWMEIDAVPIEDGLAVFFRDVTERRLSEDMLRAASDAVTFLVAYLDRRLVYRFCNRRYEEWYGRSLEEIVGCPLRQVVGDAAFEVARPHLERALSGHEVRYGGWMELPERGRRFLRVAYSPRLGPRGRAEGVYVQVEDDTEARLAQEELAEAKADLEDANARLEQLAATDALTGLWNLRGFKRRLDEEFAEARRLGRELSLMMIDVDRFKEYNDSFGHPAGDDALRKIADVLREETRDYDVAARYGGEEFALLLPSAGVAEAARAAERVRASVEKRGWHLRSLTVSLGVGTLPQDVDSPNVLVEAADRALYAAKEGGRNRVEVA
jgi:diguanylate cyclase (GGDEF)-like protein/PAS domain S-box-containing protein